MPFPNLALKLDPSKGPTGTGQLWAEATGIPDNGNNTFLLPFADAGVELDQIEAGWLFTYVIPLGPGVTGAAEAVPLLSADKRFMTVNFLQAGLDQAYVLVNLKHSTER